MPEFLLKISPVTEAGKEHNSFHSVSFKIALILGGEIIELENGAIAKA